MPGCTTGAAPPPSPGVKIIAEKWLWSVLLESSLQNGHEPPHGLDVRLRDGQALPPSGNKKHRCDLSTRSQRQSLVPVAGLEPARHRWRWILSPLRLPFHHTGFYRSIITEPVKKCKRNFLKFPNIRKGPSKYCTRPRCGCARSRDWRRPLRR